MKIGLMTALVSGTVLAASVLLTTAKAAEAQVRSVTPLNRYVVGGAVAEILDASPDGNTLAFTNSEDGQIGFVDITDPSNPQPLGTVAVPGEPTSVAITPNGLYAIAAVLDTIDDDAGETIADQQPGTLVFIDLATREIVAQAPLAGIGPDSIAITADGTKAVVAIEDEEDTDNLPGTRPGSVAIVTLNYDSPGASEIVNVPLDLSGIEGVNYVEDPQPEFVAISPDDKTAAVSLQENNAIALIDLNSSAVIRIFSAGTASHLADLTEDGDISLTEPFEGRREPDTLAFTPDGQYLVAANEGDTDQESFGDGIWSGGRGWSIFDLDGTVVFDSGSSVEELAVQYGQYPDDRSENRGIEIEGGTVAAYGDQTVAYVASERGSFIVAYDITDVTAPKLIAVQPTGIAPEGVLAIPNRNLLLTSNEEDGTIDFFTTSSDAPQSVNPNAPRLVSESVPFSAISGLVVDGNDARKLYAVPDNAIAPSRIFTIELDEGTARVTDALMITKDGAPASYDLEGIAAHPEGGFWLVSEGEKQEDEVTPNLLIHVDAAGNVIHEIPLPETEATAITRFGFEGVTASANGETVYIAVQREYEGDPENTVRIAAYNTEQQSWSSLFYPLDTDKADGWVGLSDIARDVDGSFLIVERDNQGGTNGAANARVKRIYRVNLVNAAPGSTLEKTLVVDLLADHQWIEEKIESLAVTESGYWVASDNDGGISTTRLLFLPRS